MENQSLRRSGSSGHEGHGVHVCHRCGWTFPNPHPSAKHRRAHKRICGTIEGYKLGDSELKNGSDDEDEPITPTPIPTSTPGVGNTVSDDAVQETINVSRNLSEEIAMESSHPPVANDSDATDLGDNLGAGDVIPDAVEEPVNVSQNLSEEIVVDPSHPSVENDSDDNLCSTIHPVESVDYSQQPISLHSTSEHELVETSPISSPVPDAEREEAAVGENSISFTASTALDVDAKEIKEVPASTLLESHEKEIEEAKTYAVSDTGANNNEEAVLAKKILEHESLSVESAPEVCETIVVAENVSAETLDTVLSDATMEISVDGLETPIDSSARVDSEKESDSFTEPSTILDGGNVEVGRSAEMVETDIDDGRIEEDKMGFHDLKVPEDLPSKENASPAIESVEVTTDDEAPGSQSAIEHSNPIKIAEISKDVTPQEYTEGFDYDKPIVEESSMEVLLQSSETKEEEVPNNSGMIQDADASCSPVHKGLVYAGISSDDIVTPGAKLSGDDIALYTNEDAKSSESGNCKVGTAADEPPVAIALTSDSAVATESQANQTISSVELTDAHDDEKNGAKKVFSELQVTGEEEAGSSTSDAMLSSEPALITPESHEETGNGSQLETKPELIPVDLTVSLPEETEGSNDREVLGDAEDSLQGSTVEGSDTKESTHDISGVLNESLQVEGGSNGVHHGVVSAKDVLVDSNGQTDSIAAEHISSSAPKDIEAVPTNDSEDSKESEMASLKPEGGADSQQIDKPLDLYDPPSFMTLVEPKLGDIPNEEATKTQNPEQKGPPSSQAGWFPEMAHVAVSDSPRRKRNEEIIAKVSKHQHVALKSLLGEVDDDESKEKLLSSKEDDPVSGTKNGNIITDAEKLADRGKEWNHPAVYQENANIEKAKGKSWWSPFRCCLSVHSAELSQ